MALVKLQVNVAGDSTLPRDAAINTLFFSVNTAVGGAPDYQQLALDMANIYKNTLQGGGNDNQITVRAYDAEPLLTVGGDTGPPESVQIVNAGNAPAATKPREVALCLSYYATENRPGKRGRIYLPAFAFIAMSQMGGRPAQDWQLRATAMATAFGNLGGVNVDWRLFSPKLRQHYKITNAWCDNEWDTQRSRGLKATNRETVTLGE